VVVHPGQKGAEKSGRHATVSVPRTGDATQGLLNLVAEEQARRHGVGDTECLPDVLLGLPDE